MERRWRVWKERERRRENEKREIEREYKEKSWCFVFRERRETGRGTPIAKPTNINDESATPALLRRMRKNGPFPSLVENLTHCFLFLLSLSPRNQNFKNKTFKSLSLSLHLFTPPHTRTRSCRRSRSPASCRPHSSSRPRPGQSAPSRSEAARRPHPPTEGPRA